MFYDTQNNRHGLKFDPFKALAAPRPIGWISTVSGQGIRNLAPYSFFNAISDKPPMVMFSSVSRKDSLRNIEENGDFTCSLATYGLREQMNMSSAPVSHGVDEFALAGLTAVGGQMVKSSRVGESPAAFECRHWKTIELPIAQPDQDARRGTLPCFMVLGYVVGIYIDERYVRDGLVDTAGMQPLARMGYMDYSAVTRENTFTLNRPIVGEDGKTATVQPGPWDGVYR